MLLRFIRWASYVVILGLASGCTQDAAQLLQSAKELEAKGDRVAAILNLKNALQQDPNDGVMRYMLGRLYNDTFNPVAAEKEFLKARKLGVVEEGRVEVALARALRAQGKFEELLEKVSVSPSFEVAAQASVLALRGRAQHALRLNAEAQTSFEEAAKTQADNLDVALLEAQIVSGQGDFDRALTILDGIIAKSPDHYDGWSYKAEILRALGRNDEAVTAYEHVLQLNPFSLPALLQHSALLIRKGDREAAWKDVAVLRRVYKDLPDGLVRQGMLQLV